MLPSKIKRKWVTHDLGYTPRKDCKSLHPGSIPGVASTLPIDLNSERPTAASGAWRYRRKTAPATYFRKFARESVWLSLC